MRVAAYQAPLLAGGSVDEAIALIAGQVRECETAGVDLLCCPEAVLGGLADYHDRPADLAIDVAALEQHLAPIASDTVTTIVGFTEPGPGGALYNSAAVFSKGRVAGVYRKHHPAINRSVYSAGTDTPVFEVGGLVFGIVICLDSRFAEPMSTLVSRGARMIFIPTNNGMPEKKGGAELPMEARDIDIARARGLGVPIVRADVVGRVGELVSYGSSAIIGRGGTVMAAAEPMTPGLLAVELRL